jgi:hypothetical protein
MPRPAERILQEAIGVIRSRLRPTHLLDGLHPALEHARSTGLRNAVAYRLRFLRIVWPRTTIPAMCRMSPSPMTASDATARP